MTLPRRIRALQKRAERKRQRETHREVARERALWVLGDRCRWCGSPNEPFRNGLLSGCLRCASGRYELLTRSRALG